MPWQHVEAVLSFLVPQVAAMVQLQPLMGARETEICLMRGRNIDCTGPVWWYRIDPNEVLRDGQRGRGGIGPAVEELLARGEFRIKERLADRHGLTILERVSQSPAP